MTATASSRARPATTSPCSAAAGSTGRCAFRPSPRRCSRFPADTALIDGEIAFVLPTGITDFKSLQEHIDTPNPAIRYFVFDLLSLDGKDWRKQDADGTPRAARRVDVGEGRLGLSRLCRLRAGLGPGVLRASLRGGTRRHHVEARRPALHLRPRQGLAQDQMHRGRGIRDRRLQPLRREGQAVLLAPARHVRGRHAELFRQGRHRVRLRRTSPSLAQKFKPLERARLAVRRGAARGAQGRGVARAEARRADRLYRVDA